MPPMAAQRTISVAQARELASAGRHKAAVDMCDEILEQMPGNATAICVRAHSKWKLGDDPDACLDELQRALAMAPDSAVVRFYQVEVLVSTGQFDEARKKLEEVLREDSRNVRAFSELSDITKFTEETALIKEMAALFEQGELTSGAKTQLGFALGKAYQDLKQPGPAIHFVSEANKSAERDFDIGTVHKRRADLEKYAAEHKADRARALETDGPFPIFIVGMPRSGTTLVETIIARHSRVFPAGELPVVPVIENLIGKWVLHYRKLKMGPHTALNHIPDDVMENNRQELFKYVRERSGDSLEVFTDKLPGNALRLPVISKLFPRAPIVYVRRHPLDCCLSNYFQHFSKLNFSYRQDWLGAYYRDLTETVAISRKLVPNPVLDLSYEQLVANPEPETRRLAEFVGLDWDDAFLEHHSSDRKTVMTASKWQVRQPIYKSSTAKWKPYEPYLGELIAAMGGKEWIEAEVEATALAAAGA